MIILHMITHMKSHDFSSPETLMKIELNNLPNSKAAFFNWEEEGSGDHTPKHEIICQILVLFQFWMTLRS